MAQTYKYASRAATFGNVAYDLDSLKRSFDEMTTYAEPEKVRRPAAKPQIAQAPKVRASERTRASARVQGVGISFFSALGLFAAAIMCAFVVLSYVQITEINSAKSALREELSTLKTEAEQLRVEYAMTFNLKEIEDYAVNTLGMVRLTDDNEMAVSSVRTDKGVVLSEEAEEPNVLSGLIGYLLLEYF